MLQYCHSYLLPSEIRTGFQMVQPFEYWTLKSPVFRWLRYSGVRYSDGYYIYNFEQKLFSEKCASVLRHVSTFSRIWSHQCQVTGLRFTYSLPIKLWFTGPLKNSQLNMSYFNQSEIQTMKRGGGGLENQTRRTERPSKAEQFNVPFWTVPNWAFGTIAYIDDW